MMRSQPTRRAGQGHERGQALIEFAVAASLFFLLIFGMFDAARAVWYHNTLQDATQEAARYAAVHGANSTDKTGDVGCTDASGQVSPSDNATLTCIVKHYATGLSNPSVTASWSGSPASNAIGNTVTVTATYPYTPISSYLGQVTFNISASSTRIIVH